MLVWFFFWKRIGGYFVENMHLAGVETTLSGQDKADHTHQGEQMHIGAAEHLDTQHNGSKGRIGGAAEQTDQTQRTADSGIQTQQTAHAPIKSPNSSHFRKVMV